MALSFTSLEQLAANAGFPKSMQPTMAAIALAESGGNPNSTNPNDNGGRQTSWGLWQISWGTHQAPPGWSDPQTNANMAYAKYLSQGLGAWGTYTSGRYKDFMSGSGTSQPAPVWLKDMTAWINSGGKMTMWDKLTHNPGPNAGPGEGGVDLTAPPGTPVYALGTGPLLSANTFAALGFNHPGSVLSQQVNVPGVGPENIYYQHINLMPGFQTCLGGNCGGRIIQAGQQIGTVGSVGETEVGFNAGKAWGSLYGPASTPGPWIDKPEPWIQALMTQNSSPINTTTSDTSSPSLTDPSTWGPAIGSGIMQGITGAFTSMITPLINGSFVFVGLLLLLIGIIVLFFGHGGRVEAFGFGVGGAK